MHFLRTPQKSERDLFDKVETEEDLGHMGPGEERVTDETFLDSVEVPGLAMAEQVQTATASEDCSEKTAQAVWTCATKCDGEFAEGRKGGQAVIRSMQAA